MTPKKLREQELAIILQTHMETMTEISNEHLEYLLEDGILTQKELKWCARHFDVSVRLKRRPGVTVTIE